MIGLGEDKGKEGKCEDTLNPGQEGTSGPMQPGFGVDLHKIDRDLNGVFRKIYATYSLLWI